MGGGRVKDGEPNKTQTSEMDTEIEITGTINRVRYDKTAIGPYEHRLLTNILQYKHTSPHWQAHTHSAHLTDTY